jgi:hypothetical protein
MVEGASLGCARGLVQTVDVDTPMPKETCMGMWTRGAC